MKNVLVTGGAGFIGSNFVRYLLSTEGDIQIINLDALTYAGSRHNLENLPDPRQHVFVEGDICNAPLVYDLMVEHKVDTVVHFAAETHVDRSIRSPAPFIDTNVVGTFTLLESARRYWIEGTPELGQNFRFHHISTDEVYGSLEMGEPAWIEDAPYAPNSPYAASKASSDHLVRSYGHTFQLPYTITNCSNNYGPYQFPEKFIPLMITNAMEGKPLPIYGDGKQIRDWLYVKDHCKAIKTVIQNGLEGETYHVGGGNQPTNLEVVERLCEILDDVQPKSDYVPHRKLIEFVEDRPGHDRRYALDATKIKMELNWKPNLTLNQGLRKTVEWYLDHQGWVQAVRDREDYQNWLNDHYQGRGWEGGHS